MLGQFYDVKGHRVRVGNQYELIREKDERVPRSRTASGCLSGGVSNGLQTFFEQLTEICSPVYQLYVAS
jgi:hypothetical protein